MRQLSHAEVKDKLTIAGQRLFESQPDLFSFTDATHQSEWNLARHFVNELHKEFPEYRCDTEVIKVGCGNMRPDIIVHRRGTHEFNLLVVEIKRKKADIESDIKKTTEYWFRAPLRYEFGAVVVISDAEPLYIFVVENVATLRAT